MRQRLNADLIFASYDLIHHLTRAHLQHGGLLQCEQFIGAEIALVVRCPVSRKDRFEKISGLRRLLHWLGFALGFELTPEIRHIYAK